MYKSNIPFHIQALMSFTPWYVLLPLGSCWWLVEGR